ncbi:MAG: hypothetical protein ACP5HU_05690 [Phycisphaerae bacterium]
MTRQRIEDESKLLDFLRGECDERQAEEIRSRLREDEQFRRLHDSMANALKAMELLPEREPGEDLTQRTVAKVRRHRRTQELIAREEAQRGAFRPTFRLRELAAVAAVLIVLGSVMVPAIRQARSVAAIDLCAYRAGEIGTGLLTYANDNNGLLPAAGDRDRPWLTGNDQPPTSNSAALFRLIPTRHVASPQTFQCPAVADGSFVVTAGMSDFPDGQYVSYSYQHAVGDSPLSIHDGEAAAVAEEMAILSDSNPVFEGGRFHPDRTGMTTSANHDHAGQNVLYLDMHVEWKTDSHAGVDGNNIFLAEDAQRYTGLEKPAGPTDSFLLPAYTDEP